jgi:uncharacterized protein YdcH (DUF465 family)
MSDTLKTDSFAFIASVPNGTWAGGKKLVVDADVARTLERELAAVKTERDELQEVLIRHGFIRCDIPACNCGSWHPRYGLPERMQEIKDALADAGHELSNSNGNLPLNALKQLIVDRDNAYKLLSEQQDNWERDIKKASNELERATESSMAGLRREQQRLADELRSVTAELERMRPVVEAAQRWRAGWTPESATDLINAVETYEATK